MLFWKKVNRSALTAVLLLALSVFARAEVTLRFTCWDGDDGLRVIRKSIQDFEKANPGIKVRLENVPYPNYAYKLLAQVAANAQPDVAMLEPPIFQRFSRRGVVEPLEPFIESDPSFDLSAYYKPIVDAHRYQGKLYVLPRDIAPINLIYYNKRLFKEAGIPYPDGSWTWDYQPRPERKEKCFTWVMQQLTKRDAKGKVKQWGFCPGWMGAFVDTVVYSTGSKYADDPEHPTKLLYTDPNVIRAHQFVSDLANKFHFIPSPGEITSIMQSSGTQLFIQQKAAMFQSGIWDVPGIRRSLKPGTKEFFEWDITLAPGYEDPVTHKITRAGPTGGSGYGIMKGSKHPKEAWKLLKWMAGEPAMIEMARAGLAQPAIRSLALKEPWLAAANAPIEERYPANRIATDQAVPYVRFGPSADYWGELKSIVESKLDPVYNGQRDAESALKEGEAMANVRLEQILSQQNLPDLNWPITLTLGALLILGLVVWIYAKDRSSKLTARQRSESKVALLFLSPWIAGLLVFTLGPMVLSLMMSFTDWDVITPAKFRGGTNYAEALTFDPRFWNSLKVTFLYSLISVPLALLLSLGMALLLNASIKGQAFFRAAFYVPALVSAVASSLIWRKVFQPEDGLLNALIYGPNGDGNFLGLGSLISWVTNGTAQANWLGDDRLALSSFIVMSLWGAGGGMVILLAGLQGIPQSYYEAARLDGAGAWSRFRNVTLPLLSPALFFTLITGFIGAFQTFTQALVMTNGGPNDATRFLTLHLYENAFVSLRMGYASALAWIMFAAILLFTLVQYRLNKYVYYEGAP